MSDERSRALATCRAIAVALAAGPIGLGLVALAVRTDPSSPWLAPPAALVGLVAPAAAWRVHGALREGSPTIERFVKATLVALAITEGAAILGIVAFFLSRDPLALSGLAMHVVLLGALWPSARRLDAFLDGGR